MTTETAPRIALRRAKRSDLPLLFAWRQNAEVVRLLPSFRPVTWDQHVAWWRGRHHRTDYMVLLWSGNQVRPVGTVHALDLAGEMSEVGILLGDTSAWGQGVGKRAVALLLQRPEVRRQSRLEALIHPENIASQHVFQANGFRKVGEGGRGGQWVYQWRRAGWVEATPTPGHVVHLPATGEAT